jgi:charged multivesicular body protein 7
MATQEWAKPPEWSDTDRMHFLMAPFPPGKDCAPIEDAKFKFWSKLIARSTIELNRISFSLMEVEERFLWNSLRPKCLFPVLSTMENNGQIVKLDSFLKQTERQQNIAVGLLSWGVSAISSSLSWTWRYMYGSSRSANSYQGRYLLIGRLKEVCLSVYSLHNRTVIYKTTDNVMSLDEFNTLCKQHCANHEDILLVQAQLVQEGLLCVSELKGGSQGVKFANSSKEKFINRNFTEADTAILVLKETVKHVSEQLEHHRERADKHYAAAKMEVKAKRTANAKSQLRKGMTERRKVDIAQKKIDNVEQILGRIQQAESDALVMEAYTSGLQAMKSALHTMPMSREELEDVMDEIQDLDEEQQQITDTMLLSDTVLGGGDDIDELEQELSQLTLSEKPPAVPTPKVEDSTPAPDKAAICSDKKVSGSENQPLLEVRTYTCLFCLLMCSVYVYT